MRGFVSRFVRHRPAVLGLLLLLAVVLAAVLAPVLYPASPFELVGRPFQPPLGQYPLGTDMLGRDLAAGVLHGARTTLLVGLVATVFAVLVGVTVGGAVCELTSYQFDLLLAMAERAGRVLTRDQIMEAVRGRELEAFDRSIDVHVGRIRNAIEVDSKNPKRILTVRGVGYVFAKQQD